MEIKAGKLLTFTLGDEFYGIPILQVKEIISMMEITSMPKLPKYVKGVINLRGKIIPVIDLRLKFGLEEMIYTDRTCNIVVEQRSEEGITLNGFLVDSVSEVINIEAEDIEEPASYGSVLEEDFISGIGKVKDKVIMILDVNKILEFV